MGQAMYFQAIIAIVLLCLAQFSIAEEPSGARQTVDKLNAALIEVMKNAKPLGYKGRSAKLDPIIRETHEFNAIAQIALGSHWKDLGDEQKKSFADKLTELSVATYAAQFNDYGGEAFQYESEQGMKANRVTLRYQLVAPKEKPVKFEYVLGQTNGQWVIINIVVDGISDLALKKAQYTSVIEREGFDSLMNKLSQKITDYANNNPG
jgi:phospholipid transport system substrate-binding protein